MLAPLSGEPRSRLLQALDRVAAFVERVTDACGHQLACRDGCSDCCCQVLQLRGVEAAYLLEGARALPPRAVSLVWRTLGDPSLRGVCPLLQGESCLVYAHRPAVCRTHGLPMIRRDGDRSLVHCCPRNFHDAALERLPPNLLLDEGRLSLLMDAVDALYARETGWGGGRIGVDELLRAGLQS